MNAARNTSTSPCQQGIARQEAALKRVLDVFYHDIQSISVVLSLCITLARVELFMRRTNFGYTFRWYFHVVDARCGQQTWIASHIRLFIAFAFQITLLSRQRKLNITVATTTASDKKLRNKQTNTAIMEIQLPSANAKFWSAIVSNLSTRHFNLANIKCVRGCLEHAIGNARAVEIRTVFFLVKHRHLRKICFILLQVF